jgi:hypothetical protein
MRKLSTLSEEKHNLAHSVSQAQTFDVTSKHSFSAGELKDADHCSTKFQNQSDSKLLNGCTQFDHSDDHQTALQEIKLN